MASFYSELTEEQVAFIGAQHIFFTATAAGEGRINLSPKGMDTFRVIDAHTVAYLDMTGSGNETAAHLQHDGRMTIMFCGFAQKPNILRLYGRGETVQPGSAEWDGLFARFDAAPGQRQIVRMRVESTQDSCGYAVPRYGYEGERETLKKWAVKQGEDGLRAYRAEKNVTSIDGLPIG